MNDYILQVEDLKKHFPIYGGVLFRQIASLKALDGVSFNVRRGETLGIVGESGCGKSTLAKLIAKLYNPTSGKIKFEGREISGLRGSSLKEFRKCLSMIFQDPYSSLNPRMTVEEIVAEPIKIHKGRGEGGRKSIRDIVVSLLEEVGLNADHLSRYPHEFSGGQRQRIGIARSIALRPKLLIADEPISALDISVQSQIINLLSELQQKLNLTYIFISHNLSVVEYLSDRIAVLYLGKIVELAKKSQIFNGAKHPYTISLISSMLIPEEKGSRERIILKGDVPSPVEPPSGCPFHTRCYMATRECASIVPELKNIAPDGDEHLVSCIKIVPSEVVKK